MDVDINNYFSLIEDEARNLKESQDPSGESFDPPKSSSYSDSNEYNGSYNRAGSRKPDQRLYVEKFSKGENYNSGYNYNRNDSNTNDYSSRNFSNDYNSSNDNSSNYRGRNSGYNERNSSYNRNAGFNNDRSSNYNNNNDRYSTYNNDHTSNYKNDRNSGFNDPNSGFNNAPKSGYNERNSGSNDLNSGSNFRDRANANSSNQNFSKDRAFQFEKTLREYAYSSYINIKHSFIDSDFGKFVDKTLETLENNFGRSALVVQRTERYAEAMCKQLQEKGVWSYSVLSDADSSKVENNPQKVPVTTMDFLLDHIDLFPPAPLIINFHQSIKEISFLERYMRYRESKTKEKITLDVYHICMLNSPVSQLARNMFSSV